MMEAIQNTPVMTAMKLGHHEYVKLLVSRPETDIFVLNDKNESIFDFEKEGSEQILG